PGGARYSAARRPALALPAPVGAAWGAGHSGCGAAGRGDRVVAARCQGRAARSVLGGLTPPRAPSKAPRLSVFTDSIATAQGLALWLHLDIQTLGCCHV